MPSFELFVAARYLRAKRRQAVIGIITAISVVGVAAGVAALIIALAINNGFSQDLQQRLLGSTSHVNLMRVDNDGIAGWQELSNRLEKLPHVTASAPAVYEQVLISRGARAKGAVLKGIVPERERHVSAMLDAVTQGSWQEIAQRQSAPPAAENAAPAATETLSPQESAIDDPTSLAGEELRRAQMPPIILGKDMADDLGATVGSVVMVTSPQGELTPFGIVPKYQRCRVAGIFQSGFYDYDSAWAMLSLNDAQQLFGLGSIATVIEFKVDDLDRADVIGREIEQAAGSGFMATNWMEQNKALFHALRLERIVTLITIGLIVLVAALNILISLIMMVMEKTRDIAVLVSMGCRQSQIRRIFVYQGMLIGAAGTVLGEVIGYTLSFLAGHYHWVRISAEVYTIDYVPFAPRLIDGVLVACVALAIAFLATIYPSRSAARVLPAESLRYE